MKKPPPRLPVARATPPLIDCMSEALSSKSSGVFM